MTELDFLPQWYQVRQQQRRSMFVYVWLGVSMVVLMGMWFYLIDGQLRRWRGDLAQLQSQRAQVNEELLKIDKLRATRDDLIRKSNIALALHGEPDAIHVVQQMVALVPDDVTLVELELSTEVIRETPAPAAVQSPARPGPRRIGGRPTQPTANAAPAPQVVEHNRYKLKIVGVAPADADIANFIGRLARSQTFTSVQMGYTKDLKRGARLMRQFELNCQLLDGWRPERPAPRPAGSVAAVDAQ